MSIATTTEQTPIRIDQRRILATLKLHPEDPKTQALLLVCDRYGLDPVLKHVVLIDGNVYVTRDGLLHVAHASGRFDGIEVVGIEEQADQWVADVSVFRKDMSHPFTYTGRYLKSEQNRRYGPEMAVKRAEVMALRRAFDVTGIAAADEIWDPLDVATSATDSITRHDAKQALVQLCAGDIDRASALWDAYWQPRGDPPKLLDRAAFDDLISTTTTTITEGPTMSDQTENSSDQPIDVGEVPRPPRVEQAPAPDAEETFDEPADAPSNPPAEEQPEPEGATFEDLPLQADPDEG